MEFFRESSAEFERAGCGDCFMQAIQSGSVRRFKRASVRWGEKARFSLAMPSGSRGVSTAEASAPNPAPVSTPAQNTLGRRSFGKNPTFEILFQWDRDNRFVLVTP